MNDVDLMKLKNEIAFKLNEFKAQTAKLQTDFEKTILSLSKKGYKVDKDRIFDFMERFWHVYPTKNPYEWEVAIPVFIPFNIGWFDRTDGGYNIFIINKYTKWLGEEIPAFINDEINLPADWKLSVDGQQLAFPEDLQEKVQGKFGKYLSLIEKNKAVIKQGHELDLIAEIIDSGSLPFVPHPVDRNDLRESQFTQIWDELNEKYNPLEIFSGKYSYQGEAWKLMEKYGAIGIFWLMSFGKTVIGTYIYSRIKPIEYQHGLVLPTRTLDEQWKEFWERNCPPLLDETERFTYQGMSRQRWTEMKGRKFTVLGFDECLPYNAKVLLADGTSEIIGRIVEEKLNVKVLSYNTETGQIESKRITRFFKVPCLHPLVKIKHNKGEFVCTSDHKILTERGYIPAKDLRIGEDAVFYREMINHISMQDMRGELPQNTGIRWACRHSTQPGTSEKENSSEDEESSNLLPGAWEETSAPKGRSYNKVDRGTKRPNLGRSPRRYGNTEKSTYNEPKVKNPPGFKTSRIYSVEILNVEESCAYLSKNIKERRLGTGNNRFLIKESPMFERDLSHHYNRWKEKSIQAMVRTNNDPSSLSALVHGRWFLGKGKGKMEGCSPLLLQILNGRTKSFTDLAQREMGIGLNSSEGYSPQWVLYKVESAEQPEVPATSRTLRPTNSSDEIQDSVYDIEVEHNHNFFSDGVLVSNCHFLPAESFSKLGTVTAKYRFGLSATPYREDGRTNYIMALTGFPVGLDSRSIMTTLGKEYHTVNVHVVKDLDAKYELVKQLYDPEKRTIIFVDLLQEGRNLSDMFDIPFISGETKNRLKIIQENKSFVASRVLELGVSIKDLERVLEFGFFKGSRKEEVQKSGRLMHSEVEGKVHDILFTREELEKFGKRLQGLYEKGFRPKLIPHLAGVQPLHGEEVERKKKVTIKATGNIVQELFSEGYFVKERTFIELSDEVLKRGGKFTTGALFGRLNTMVRQGKLYKIKGEDGYKFKQR